MNKEKGLEIKSLHIKYIFTEDEKKDIAADLAEKMSEKADKELQKKETASKYTSEINSLDVALTRMSGEYRQGYTYKNWDCYEVFDYDTKQVFTHRADTEEQVSVRTMSSAEYQREMFDPREKVNEDKAKELYEDINDLLEDEGENKPTEYLNDKPVE